MGEPPKVAGPTIDGHANIDDIRDIFEEFVYGFLSHVERQVADIQGPARWASNAEFAIYVISGESDADGTTLDNFRIQFSPSA